MKRTIIAAALVAFSTTSAAQFGSPLEFVDGSGHYTESIEERTDIDQFIVAAQPDLDCKPYVAYYSPIEATDGTKILIDVQWRVDKLAVITMPDTTMTVDDGDGIWRSYIGWERLTELMEGKKLILRVATAGSGDWGETYRINLKNSAKYIDEVLTKCLADAADEWDEAPAGDEWTDDSDEWSS